MNRHTLIQKISTLIIFIFSALNTLNAQNEPMAKGIYEPNWESLSQYSNAPEWFQNAKFGIWAHWGPQCQPEQGD